MIGLRPYPRDLELARAAGDAALLPPDPGELLELVRQRMWDGSGAAPGGVDLVYARWKPGVSLVTAHVLEFEDDERETLVVKTYAQGKPFSPEARQREAVERLRPSLSLDDPARALHVFPVDRALPGAVRALDTKRTARQLEQAGVAPGAGISARRSRVEVLRYKPGRRLVARYTALLRASGKQRVDFALRALPVAAAGLHVERRVAIESLGLAPRLLYSEGRTGVLVEEWVEGTSAARDDYSTLAAIAPALARLHAVASPGSSAGGAAGGVARPVPSAADTLAALFAWAPELNARFLRLPPRRPTQPRAWLHGDLHPDQVIRCEGGALRLLDWDGLRPGEPLEDLAAWAAGAMEVQDGQRDPEGLLAEVLRTYAASAGEEIPFEDAASAVVWELAERAAGSVRRLELGACSKAAGLLDVALAMAPRGAGS